VIAINSNGRRKGMCRVKQHRGQTKERRRGEQSMDGFGQNSIEREGGKQGEASSEIRKFETYVGIIYLR